jgi:hypothetical protein
MAGDMPGLVSACSCCISGIPPAASRPSAAALAPFPRGATVGFPSVSSLPPSGAYQTRVSDLSKSSQYRSWSIIYQIAILDKRTPVDIMVELVVIVTAKLRNHKRDQNRFSPVQECSLSMGLPRYRAVPLARSRSCSG